MMLTMAKKQSVSIRFRIEVAAKVSMVSAAFGKTVPEYLEEITLAALARDLPKAAQIVKKQADESQK